MVADSLLDGTHQVCNATLFPFNETLPVTDTKTFGSDEGQALKSRATPLR